MSHQDSNCLIGSPAEIYERFMVPAQFAPWVSDLLTLVQLKPGDRLLDLACGTGIVARKAVRQVGESGRVVGLDNNPRMLEMARSLDTSIEWTEANAMDVPFSDADFDIVVCQQGLQFMPDRLAAVEEMYRVLAPGGRVAIATWFSLEHIPGFFAIAQGLARHVSNEVAGLMHSAFSLGDSGEVRALFEKAGFDIISIRDATKSARFPSVEDFVRVVVIGGIVGRSGIVLSDETLSALIGDVSDELQPYIDDQGLAFPMTANLATARK